MVVSMRVCKKILQSTLLSLSHTHTCTSAYVRAIYVCVCPISIILLGVQLRLGGVLCLHRIPTAACSRLLSSLLVRARANTHALLPHALLPHVPFSSRSASLMDTFGNVVAAAAAAAATAIPAIIEPMAAGGLAIIP